MEDIETLDPDKKRRKEVEGRMQQFTKEDFEVFMAERTATWSLTRKSELRDELSLIESCELGLKQHTTSEARKEEFRAEIKERSKFIQQEFTDNPDFVHEQWKEKVTGGHPEEYQSELFDDAEVLSDIRDGIYEKFAKRRAEEGMAKYTKEDFEEFMSEGTCWWTKERKNNPDFKWFNPEMVYEGWKGRATRGYPTLYRPELFEEQPFDPEEYEREMFEKQENGTFEWEITDKSIRMRGGNTHDYIWLEQNVKKKKH